ncbi:MAG: hydantoinase/oxoprolinase family protein [Lautropia sp.]
MAVRQAPRIACDIGGTFTDLALALPDGQLLIEKLPTTVDDPARAILDGFQRLCQSGGVAPEEVAQLLHASTIATNAILEGKGARTALLTTAGFRDVLELRRIRMPRLYEPLYQKPAPLVPRRWRYEVRERLEPDGTVRIPLEEADAMARIAEIRAQRIESIAICLLHSYADPAHERQLAALIRRELPEANVSLSVDVLPEAREYERTSTTVINAYVGPAVRRYLGSIRDRLAAANAHCPILMMQSSGGLAHVERALALPAEVVESGPAAGVIGAARLAAVAKLDQVVTFDMGGTTAKAALIEAGRPSRTDEYEVGGGVSVASSLSKGGGYALRFPVIDVAEVGAGGGSLVTIDAGGVLKVGPQSAGATPGPVCYGRGGHRVTVTDANVVLGYVNPERLGGGSVMLRPDLSHAAIETQIASPLGISVAEAALAIHRVASSTMMRAVRAVTTQRGRDPREFCLFAFGGNGGVHGAQLARDLGIRRVLIPPAAGIFSALGLFVADVAAGMTKAFLHRLRDLSGSAVEAGFATLEQGSRMPNEPASRWDRAAALRYVGQAHELTIPIDPAWPAEELVGRLRSAFEAEHERTYGYRQDPDKMELVALRSTWTKPATTSGGAAFPRSSADGGAPGPRSRGAYFGDGVGLLETPIVSRSGLVERAVEGPLIIDEEDCSTVVPPGATVRVDELGLLDLHLPVEGFPR